MNEPTPPSRDRVNFPSAIGAGAEERQSQYRRQPNSPDAASAASSEALATLVQELTQQNHQLRAQVAQFEAEVEDSTDQGDGRPAAAVPLPEGGPEGGPAAQVAYLLNQLEFAQQANQRQAIRIDSLAQQANTDRLQLRQQARFAVTVPGRKPVLRFLEATLEGRPRVVVTVVDAAASGARQPRRRSRRCSSVSPTGICCRARPRLS